MPQASGAGRKYAYLDHDSAYINEAPPVQNTWYEVFHEYDVRLLYCVVMATDELAAGADIEVKWTIDGNEYFTAFTGDSDEDYFIYRDYLGSLVGTAGLLNNSNRFNGSYYVDKRGQDFKVEVRVTSDVLETDILEAWCVYETLEAS